MHTSGRKARPLKTNSRYVNSPRHDSSSRLTKPIKTSEDGTNFTCSHASVEPGDASFAKHLDQRPDDAKLAPSLQGQAPKHTCMHVLIALAFFERGRKYRAIRRRRGRCLSDYMVLAANLNPRLGSVERVHERPRPNRAYAARGEVGERNRKQGKQTSRGLEQHEVHTDNSARTQTSCAQSTQNGGVLPPKTKLLARLNELCRSLKKTTHHTSDSPACNDAI
eukprot:6212186-Pleurochrysis_carterae.AAC.2